MKTLRALDEFLLAALRFLGLGQNVDVPAGQLRGEPHVLAAPADGQRQLIVGHDDLDAVEVLVEHDLDDFRRLQRVDDEGRGVRRPGNDVDALALQFADHRLHARAAHADAGADRIDRANRARPRRSWRASPGSRATDFTSMTPS